MSTYVLGADAESDLDEIWEYIAKDSVDAADHWIGKLFDAFEALGRMCGMGHKREDLTAYPVLFWPVGSYLIIYPAGHRPVEIVAVTQGSRDVPLCLRPHRNARTPSRTLGVAHPHLTAALPVRPFQRDAHGLSLRRATLGG